ncbi:MAG: TIGR03905 family TSCPD domain-containing protein [Oscillospiraceae bacterium]|nr:TIGR03905 family TSCPD domain-containing protein [Oscillospiraceae bacterium]
MTYTFTPRGVCSRRMTVELEDGVIRAVHVEGGCDGNLQGISRLVVGMSAQDAIERLKGIRCGIRPTSCPDQLSQALEQALAQAV